MKAHNFWLLYVWSPCLIALAWAILPAQADVIYEVGPGKTYATIQAAINAMPANVTFTDNHVVRIYAGTYGRFETFQGGAANNKLPTFNNRMIIEAVPGEEVIINQGDSLIRSNYVTVQGIKFQSPTPLGTGSHYLIQNNYSEARGGAIIYNNEFINGGAFRHRGLNTLASEFSYAFVHNLVTGGSNNNYIDANLADNEKELIGGNVVHSVGLTTGENFIIMQTPAGSANKYVLNNTLISNTDDAITDLMLRVINSQNTSPLTVANNLFSQSDATTPFDRSMQFEAGTGNNFTGFASLYNNLQYDNAIAGHFWSNLTDLVGSSRNYASLTAFLTGTNGLNALGFTGRESGSIDNTDPLFADALLNDYRLQPLSVASKGGNASIFSTALTDLGITSNLASYFNPLRDPGYDLTYRNIGALATIPEPASMAVMVMGCLLALGCRSRRS